MKMDVFWSSSKQKKNATTMAYMNMILIRTLKDNMNFDIVSKNCFQFTHFLLFHLVAPERIFKIYNFPTLPSVRAYDNETAAKLVCRGQIG